MNKAINTHLIAMAFMLGLATPLLAASASPSGGSDDVVVNAFLRDQIRSVVDQVRSYGGALKSLMQDAKHAVQASAAQAKIDALLRRTDKLAGENRLKEALGVAEEANRLVVESIVRMRSGETVVVSLSFDSPAQEFAYEKRRFESSEVMIAMTLEDGRSISASSRTNIEAMLREAHRQRQSGEQEARANKYAEAVRTLEGANRQLIRVLQELGVPVF
jgi:hypothetical protein